MQSIVELLQDFFGFSRKEVRGFLVLVGLMLTLWFAPLIYDRFSPAIPTRSKTDDRTADSLVAILEKIQPEKPAYQNFESRKEDSENPERPFVLTTFDPNTADSPQLQALGIPKFLAERIIKYRSKGGKFRKKEDLQRIYGFPSKLYQKLEPYIALSTDNQNNINSNTDFKSSTLPENKPTFTKPVIAIFDINRTDTTQLIKLRGIGSKLATRIVKFRDGLGGFHSEAQYAEIFGLDSLALSELHKYAQVKSEVAKINLNTATIEALDKHPYISGKQAQLIVRYREQHGNYQNVQDLLKIKVFDQQWAEKIAPYLSF